MPYAAFAASSPKWAATVGGRLVANKLYQMTDYCNTPRFKTTLIERLEGPLRPNRHSKQAAIRIRQGDETAWTRFLV
jgi:hypothetical protein